MAELKYIQNNLVVKPSKDYELIDSGEGEKLERFGQVVVHRPDPQVLWNKSLEKNEWEKADAHFLSEDKKGKWEIKKDIPEEWNIEISGLSFFLKLANFKHVGIFPEQSDNWDWIAQKISGKKISVLNLFGYTGGATLAAAKAGAQVVHVDASKNAITTAKRNAEASGLKDASIRWILDDAVKFLGREIKRENKYDAIVMDPPAFGRGPDGEVWKIKDDFLKLIDLCKELLSDKPVFIIINGYASGFSAIAYKNVLAETMKKYGGDIEFGEMTIQEKENSNKLLPAGIFARWSSK